MAEQYKTDRGRRAFMARLALLAGSSLAGSSVVLGEAPERGGSGMTAVKGGAAMTEEMKTGKKVTVKQAGAAMTEEMKTGKKVTVKQVIAALLADIPGAPFPGTVDTIKAGDADQEVTGIVTTMFATNEVIAETIRLGANFIIAHEPTFYNHEDEVKWLGDDPVLKAKQGVLQQHGITVWRFHDGIHRHTPDGIRMGVMQALGWEKQYNPAEPALVVIPAATLGDLVAHVKKSLGIEHLKYIGDLGQPCSKLVLLPGAPGGQKQIGAIQQYQPDLLITGELNEWETSEYVRDARYLGEKIALVVLGHSVSEEPGMEWLVPVLKGKVPGIPVTHLVSGDAFSWR